MQLADGRHGIGWTSIVDPQRSVTVLQTQYDAGGQVTALTDASGKSASVNTGPQGNGQASQAVTDLSGSSTEVVSDPHGLPLRQIQSIRDKNGNVTGYLVSVHRANAGGQRLIFDTLSNVKR